MTPMDQMLFDEKMKGLSAKIESSYDLILVELKYIRLQTEQTNGRVNKLEANSATKEYCEKCNTKVNTIFQETSMIRWFERNPVRFGLIVFIFLVIQIPAVRELLFGWF